MHMNMDLEISLTVTETGGSSFHDLPSNLKTVSRNNKASVYFTNLKIWSPTYSKRKLSYRKCKLIFFKVMRDS